MMTLFTAGGVCSAAALTRRYLDRTSRREETFCRGHVELTEVWNDGAAFSLPVSRRGVEVLSVAALAAAWCERRRAPIAAGLILGGGCANLYERRRHGKVYDYVRFPKAPGKAKRYVWNLADFAVLAGAAGLLLAEKK